MADLLTHVLLAYALAALVAWRWDRLAPAHVAMAPVGALLPDLAHVLDLLLPAPAVGATLGVPWSWRALHTVGGAALVGAAILALVPPRHRRPAAAALALGLASHLGADLLKATATGPLAWPLSGAELLARGGYVSEHRWPALAAALLAALAWLLLRFRHPDGENETPIPA